MMPRGINHPKGVLLEMRLGISRATRVGLLECLWWLTIEYGNRETGTIPFTGHHIASFCGLDIPGEDLMAALIECGWVDAGDPPRVHDWEDHKPRFVRDAERKKRWRESRDSHGTVTGQSAEFLGPAPPSGSGSGSGSDKSVSNETDREGGSRRIPPTLEDVQKRITDMGYDVDAEAFVDFYESKGWLVGKAKMKSWHHALSRCAREGWARQDPAAKRQARNGSPEHKRAIERHRLAYRIHRAARAEGQDPEAALTKAGLTTDDLQRPD